jgi:hypothetical protein
MANSYHKKLVAVTSRVTEMPYTLSRYRQLHLPLVQTAPSCDLRAL